VVCTGDVFTHAFYSNETRLRVKQLIRDARCRVGMAVYVIGGNHSGDCEGRDPATTVNRELGQFVFDGYLQYLGNLFEHSLDYSLPGGMVIRGYSAYTEINTVDAEKVVGLVAHHWIMDAFGDSLVIYPDDMKKVFPNLRFIVAGHDHAYHEPYVSTSGVLVLRPGSLMRTDSGVSSNRFPIVYLYKLEAGEFTPFLVEVAKSYYDVFHADVKGINSNAANAVDKFVRLMQSNISSVLDITQVIREQLALVPVEDRAFISADLASQGYLL
jgi:hypothetical protein